MKPAVTSGVRWAVIALAWPLSISAQSAGTNSVAQGPVSPSFEISTSVSPVETQGLVYREIDDPHTGEKWLLLRDPNHPAGPGRLVLAQKPQTAQLSTESSSTKAASRSNPDAPSPIILAGDALTVERETATVSEQFEAVALEPAAKGSVFGVRLKMSGKVFRAVAQAPGRAALDFASGVTK